MKRRMNIKSVLSLILCVALLTGMMGNYTQSSAEETESNTNETESLEDARQLWMHFDNEDCNDYSDNPIAIQTVGTMSYETGHAGTGKALTLNSAGKDYVNLGKAVSLQSKQVTVSAWIKAPENGFIGEQILLWCKPSAKWNEKGYYITLNADCGVYLNVGAGADGAGDGMVRAKAGNSGASFFPAGEWVHLAVTFDSDSNDAAIYRNGEKQKINYAGADKNKIEQDGENDKFLAASGYGNGLTGALDDVAIYNRVATQNEICELAGVTKQSRVDADADKLNLDKNVSEDFSLPLSGDYGSSITWESHHPGIKIENNMAIVTREDNDVTGKLIATVNIDGVKQSKEIEVTVKGQSTNKVSAVDFTRVKVTDKFFAARQKQVICSILKVGIEKVEAKDGGFNNFEEAKKDIIETLNKWIPYIEGAQEEDGYLDTFFTLDRGTQNMSATTAEKKKWTDFRHMNYMWMDIFMRQQLLYIEQMVIQDYWMLPLKMQIW